MRKKVNITDVALAAGVSKATVSNYLNNRGAHFSEKTAARIRKAVSSLRYIPDPGARGIKSLEGGKSLGIVIRDSMNFLVTGPYFQQVLPIICDTLGANGYRSLIIPETRDVEKDVTYVRELSKGLIAGYFIFNIEEHDDPYVNALQLDGANFICIGYNRQVNNFVASRQDLGAERAVAHLIENHNAKRIAAIPGGRASQNVIRDRVKGYRAGLDAHGIKFDEKLVVSAQSERDNTATRLRELVLSKNPPDSQLIHQVLSVRNERDNIAPRLRELLLSKNPPDSLLIDQENLPKAECLIAEIGLRVPEDLRLVVFDLDSSRSSTRYSGIHLRLTQLAKVAVDKMLRLLRKIPDDNGGIFLDVDFAPGESCGCR